MSMSGSRLLFCNAVSFTKRAQRFGCEAGTANDFLEPSAAASGGHQCSNRPCVLKRTQARSYGLRVCLSSLSLVGLFNFRARPTQTEADERLGGLVRKPLVYGQVARQHAAHEVLGVQQRLSLEVNVEIPRQMEEPAALGPHF